VNKLRALGGGLCATVALVGLAFGPQCGGGGGSSAGHDASAGTDGADGRSEASPDAALHPDTGPLDTGVPVDSSTTVDSGVFYNPGDACPPPLDAGTLSDWPGFRRLTELDPCCPTDVALNPAQVAPPVTWVPCPSNATGCVQMPAGWNSAYTQFSDIEISVAEDGAPAYMHVLRLLSQTQGEHDIYSFPAGSPLGAWRVIYGSLSCETATIVGGASATIYAFVNGGAPTGTFVAAAAPASLAAAPRFVRIGSDLLLAGIQSTGSSETTFGFDLGGGAIGRAPLDGGSSYVTAAGPGQVSVAFVSRGDVFAQSNYGTAGWGQIYVMQPNNSLVLLRSNTNAHVSAIATDGPDVYWGETFGSMDLSAQQHDTQVWTAPYTDDPVQLATTARQIADIPGTTLPQLAIAFGGHYAFWTSSGTYVVRASDGAVVVAPKPIGYQYQQLVYVTDTELWAVMANSAGATGVAFARVTLGPWTGVE